MSAFAQTNLALYRQLLDRGYAPEDLAPVQRAYFFSARAVSARLRGSGKPFVCHLVGTASILAELDQSLEVIQAALLHAMYIKSQADFGRADRTRKGKKSIRRRRRILVREFGREVEGLVYAYHRFKWRYHKSRIDEDTIAAGGLYGREAVLLRLANELEDFLDGAVHLHGRAGESEKVRKGAAWRLRYMEACESNLIHAAEYLGYPQLAGWYREAFSQTRAMPDMTPLRTGYYASVRVPPPSLESEESGSRQSPRKAGIARRVLRRLVRFPRRRG